jgi:uncharacterized protein YkwD
MLAPPTSQERTVNLPASLPPRLSLPARSLVVAAATFLVLAGARAAHAAELASRELGQAPQRHESQDISYWSYDLAPKAAKTREQVVALYKSVYVPGNAVALNWTGAVASCDPGLTNLEHQQAVIDRINYYRALVDLPPVTLMMPGAGETAQVQATALMMSAHNALSHAPPQSWTCYSAAGASGAMSANIALGIAGVGAIDLYMTDSDASNRAVGHRRWILFPPRAAMTTGDVSGGNQPPRPANALYVLGPQTTRPATPNGIAWPPAGFVPYQNLPAMSNRWSLSFPGADFAGATVSMSGPNGPIPVTLEPLANGFGDNTIVWLPAGVAYSKPAADTTYTIAVSGLTGAGVPASISYSVTVIDPDAAPPPSTSPDLAQHGLTGSWYEPAASGQGVELELFATGAGTAFMQGAWFTFDAGTVGGAERQRWYTFSGNAQSGQSSIPVTIYRNTGGNFVAPPATSAVVVGNGALAFSSCTAGTFTYTFTDGSGRSGTLDLARLTANVTCAAPAPGMATHADFGFSGNWYNPATSGQGFVIEVNPITPFFFLTWYTYAPNGQNAGAAGQRWYTGQVPYTPGARTIALTLYETKGGLFDQPTTPAPTTVSVGTATVTFTSCTAATITYNFTGGSSAGASSTIALSRVGPTPQGCGP